jgi:glycine oxidase
VSESIAVLGAGLLGRLIALELARDGHRVEVYERSGPDGSQSAAYAAAAMLAPLAESVEAESLIVELGRASLGLWPALLQQLPAPVFFQQDGTVILWHPQDRDQAAQFGQRVHRLAAELPAGERARDLSGAELETLEPGLGRRFARGLFLPKEGQLDNRALLAALGTALTEAGVSLHWQTEAAPGGIEADWIIDCRGLGAKPDWQAVRGVRGEVLRVQAPEVRLSRPVRLLHPRYPLYIAPKPDGVYVIGATQIESEDTSPASVRSALELLSALYSVHPAFGEARILEVVSQCRPALPDNLPEIRWEGGRVIRINGLYRHGYLIAPAVLEAALGLFRRISEHHAQGLEAWCATQRWAPVYHFMEAA